MKTRILFFLCFALTAFGAPVSQDPPVTYSAATGVVAKPANFITANGIQPHDTDLDLWSAVTPATGIGAWLAAPSSANLRSALTDESGTGALIFAGGNIGAASATSIDVGSSSSTLSEISAGVLGVEGTALVKSGQEASLVDVVFEGDSLTSSSGITGSTGCWPYQYSQLNGNLGKIAYHNIATSGDVAQDAVDDFPTQAQQYGTSTTGRPSIYMLWIGTNDIASGESATDTFDILEDAWALARAQGMKVVAFTITDRTDNTSPENVQLAALNALIRGAIGTDYDVLVDVAQLTVAATDTSDGIHFTAPINRLIGIYVNAALNGIENSSVVQNAFCGHTTTQTFTSTADVVFSAVEYNTRNSFDGTTFTASCDGIYEFSAFLVGSGTLLTTNYITLLVDVNSGATDIKLCFVDNVAITAANIGFGGGAHVKLTKGDAVKLVFATDGSFTSFGGRGNSWFCGRLLQRENAP